MKPTATRAHNGNATGDLAIEYLEKYPHQPTRTIARLLVKEHPGVFTGQTETEQVDKCRIRLTKFRVGCAGMGQGAFVRPKGKQSDCAIPVPPPIADGDDWRIVPVDFLRALLLYDIHIPFHDEAAVQVALQTARKEEVDCIVLGGDLMDFYACSSWERDPRLRDLKAELHLGERFLEVLRDTFKRAQIIYLEGNHEERLWRYAWRNVPELAQMEELSLKEMLHCDDYGVRVVDGKKPLLAGPHLHILHGHEFGGFMTNPVNPARGLNLRAKVNATCGHFHQSSNHTEPGLGHPVSTWSSGCLCNLHPRYRPINKWNHGFQIVELHRAAWSLRNKKIIQGQVV